jgi:hypothetical protein
MQHEKERLRALFLHLGDTSPVGRHDQPDNANALRYAFDRFAPCSGLPYP